MCVTALALGGAGYTVYKTQAKTSIASNTTSHSKNNTSSTTSGSSSKLTTKQSTAYFTITQWGVRAPYSGTDLTYSPMPNSSNEMWLTSQQLTHAAPVCPSGNAGSIGRYLPTDNISTGPTPETAQQYLSQNFAARNSAEPIYSKVGSYYYIYWDLQNYCTTNTTVIGQADSEVESIVKNLQAD
jgi:hypothetical protein